jgi:hypothetical protein
MAKTVDEYIGALSGWQADAAQTLRREMLAAEGVTEGFKWGHPIYEAGGPVCLFKAHRAHITVGFWRGTEMQANEPRLEAGSGGATMAYIKLDGAEAIEPGRIRGLVATGVALNREKGDPLRSRPAK